LAFIWCLIVHAYAKRGRSNSFSTDSAASALAGAPASFASTSKFPCHEMNASDANPPIHSGTVN